ncbi:MAG TPA: response regulator transcription factor [Terriglobales bacterium]|jgi:DNA-binding NarL/FixJ family response regulator|nr:response regulator transcription factor [Terriglobales bacterium]
MGSTSVSTSMGNSVSVEPGEGIQLEDGKGTIRVIVADSQAIFRAGLRKIFALEDDVRVVGQAESLDQTIAAIQKFSADIVIFEAALASNPADAVSDLLRQSASCRLVVVLQEPDQEMTLDLFRRGAHGVVSREVEPEMLVECLRKVSQGEPWLESRAVAWVLQAYRTQGLRPAGSRPKVSLTPKESLIVSCVTQGMKNKEIALRVGTTEQVVKNYLRKVYDKLGVADRLELALYCLNHRVVEGVGQAKPAVQPTNGHAPAAPDTPNAAAAASGSRS